MGTRCWLAGWLDSKTDMRSARFDYALFCFCGLCFARLIRRFWRYQIFVCYFALPIVIAVAVTVAVIGIACANILA